jgi:hypothetical protein
MDTTLAIVAAVVALVVVSLIVLMNRKPSLPKPEEPQKRAQIPPQPTEAAAGRAEAERKPAP